MEAKSVKPLLRFVRVLWHMASTLGWFFSLPDESPLYQSLILSVSRQVARYFYYRSFSYTRKVAKWRDREEKEGDTKGGNASWGGNFTLVAIKFSRLLYVRYVILCKFLYIDYYKNS